ncbi:hypothetical protein ACNRWW_12710 [Metabacillus sp. HB246100]|uniref:hypothetical protein n=1 Tax=Bacillus weihaiensis TaxID=1547283 RepID=UPI00235426A8|nr:hypothetical protein [Bacillus weihaiensis]
MSIIRVLPMGEEEFTIFLRSLPTLSITTSILLKKIATDYQKLPKRNDDKKKNIAGWF